MSDEEIFEDIRGKIMDLANKSNGLFSSIQRNFLDIMHFLDTYRKKGIVPEGEYRQKGNLFRDLISGLIEKKCGFKLRDRKVLGLTDIHDLDLVFLIGDKLILAGEVKMLGTPSHITSDGERKPPRGGSVDLDKRLKEVKYTAIDLKLRYGGVDIGRWNDWIARASPNFYSIWGCMVTDAPDAIRRNNVELMISKFLKLRNYNNGVGVLFYHEQNEHYVEVLDRRLEEIKIDEIIKEICRNLKST